MKPSPVLTILAALTIPASCSDEPPAQVSPHAAFSTPSSAVASLRSAWDELETRIDAALLQARQAAQAAIAAAAGADAARAEADALDELRTRHTGLALAILRLEILHREASSAAKLADSQFDQSGLDARNDKRAGEARKRLASGYREARKAIQGMR